MKNVNMTEAEYREAVAKAYYSRVGKSDDAQKFFVSNEAQSLIKWNWEGYSDPNYTLGGCEPDPTGRCIALMYQ